MRIYLQDIEKLGPKKGVIQQSIKDVVQVCLRLPFQTAFLQTCPFEQNYASVFYLLFIFLNMLKITLWFILYHTWQMCWAGDRANMRSCVFLSTLLRSDWVTCAVACRWWSGAPGEDWLQQLFLVSLLKEWSVIQYARYLNLLQPIDTHFDIASYIWWHPRYKD